MRGFRKSIRHQVAYAFGYSRKARVINLYPNKKAEVFFKTLNKANLYGIAWRLQIAKKSETREKRMKALLEMLARGEKLH